MNQIVIGKAGKQNVCIDLDVLLRTRLLVQANSGGGKSWLLRLIAEQLFGKVPVHIIDPEGEFASLREKFPFVLIGEGGEAAADIRSAGLVAQRLLELRAPAVIDLYEAFRSKPLERRQWVRRYLEALVDAPKKLWQPLIVIVDEAHKFCPQESPKGGNQQEREIINGCKDAMIALSTVGRKRRFCAIWATQRLAKVDKDASAELLNRLIGLTFEDVDIDRAADMLSISKEEKREFKASIRIQEPGNWFAIGRAISKARLLFKANGVTTSHPDIDTTDYAAAPPPTPEKVKALLPKLSDLPKEAEEKARTEKEYKTRIRELEGEVKKLKARTATVAEGKGNEESKRLEQSTANISQQQVVIRHLEQRVADLAGYAAGLRNYAIQKDQAIVQIGDAIGRVAAPINRLTASGVKMPDPPKLPKKIPAVEIQTKGTLRDRAIAVQAPATRKQESAITNPRPETTNSDGLTPYQMDLLGGLAMLEAIGKKEPGRALVAASAGKSVASSTFMKYVARLKESGLVEYGTGTIRLSDRGREAAPPADKMLTSADLQKKVLDLFTPYQQKLTSALIDAHPGNLTREELGRVTGLQSTSSTFMKYIAALKSAEVLEYPDKGHVKAADWLFLE